MNNRLHAQPPQPSHDATGHTMTNRLHALPPRPHQPATICRPTGRHRRNLPLPTDAKLASPGPNAEGRSKGGVRAQFGPHAPGSTLGTAPCAKRQRSADRMP